MKKIELETPIDEMSETDLRQSFSEVMEAHEENVEEFSELKEQAEKVAEYKETVEELQADVHEASGYFARRATTVTGLNEDILVDRFSVDELVELAGKADEVEAEALEQEFSQETPEGDDDGEEDDESLFAEKPSKAPKFSTDALESRKEEARQRLSRLGGISVE